MALSSSAESSREEQLEELLALAAIFGVRSSSSVDGALHIDDAGIASFLQTEDPAFITTDTKIKFELHLCKDNRPWIRLRCQMLDGYPNTPAVITAHFDREKGHRSLLQRGSPALADLNGMLLRFCATKGEESEVCIYAATVAIEEWMASRLQSQEYGTSKFTAAPKSETAIFPRPLCKAPALVRVFFWTHHTRRKQLLIYKWSEELRVSGRITVSKPGYLYAEGREDAMAEFTKRNMAEHWREIRITWQQHQLQLKKSVHRVSDAAIVPSAHTAAQLPLPAQSSLPAPVKGNLSKNVPGDEAGPASIDTLRWFPDGMREVSVPQFASAFRAIGHVSALACGTRGAIPR